MSRGNSHKSTLRLQLRHRLIAVHACIAAVLLWRNRIYRGSAMLGNFPGEKTLALQPHPRVKPASVKPASGPWDAVEAVDTVGPARELW